MKYIAGPWIYKTGHKGKAYISDSKGVNIVDIGAIDHANATLIAAAPDMLIALRNLLDMVTDNRTHGEEVIEAANVLAKAEGRE